MQIFTFVIFYFMVYCTLCWCCAMYKILKNGPDKTTRKKWKLICKWEHRDSYRQEILAMGKYIERYTEDNNVDWSRYI